MPFISNPKAGCAGRSQGGFIGVIWLVRLVAGIMFWGALHYPVTATGAPFATTYSLTFVWDSSPDSGAAYYRVYCGGASRTYTNSVMTDQTTTATVSGLSCGVTYYFAVTAVSMDSRESDFSNEVVYRREFPGAQLEIHGLAGGQYKLTMTGVSGRSYDVQATVDFRTWIYIGSATVGADGHVGFVDPNAALYPHRFYRLQETEPVGPAVARAQMQIQGGAGAPVKLTVIGLAGHTYEIEATVDFRVWNVIGTVAPATDGPVNFTDPNAANFSQRFYRTRENP